jgi:hypothetical protein
MLSNIGVYLQFIRVDVAEETFLSIFWKKSVYLQSEVNNIAVV